MSDVASDRAAQARSLARRFAATLQHLRSIHGVEYVSAVAMPGSERGIVDEVDADQEAAQSPQSVQPPRSAQSAQSAQSVPQFSADQPQRSSNISQPQPRASQGTAATEWSAATKLAYLRNKNVGDCRRCALCQGRQNIVFGVGDPDADIMFVGEAPGAEEDRRGEPFVGRAGQRLDEWLAAVGLRREQVYIANVLKCRPPNNRDPKPEEIDRCAPFLKAQIRAIAPRVLVALGRHAGMLLSQREDLSLRAMRMARLTYDASGPKDEPGVRLTPLVVTYHPAYVLRQENSASTGRGPSANEIVLEDLRRAVQIAHAPPARAPEQ